MIRFLLTSLCSLACAACLHGAEVGLRFPASQPLVFTGIEPQSIRIDVETGLALAGLNVTLELRRYDADGRLDRSARPASAIDTTEDIRGGGDSVYLQISIPATGFYELAATATDSDGKIVARQRTVLVALQKD